jgi:hypothetical protein
VLRKTEAYLNLAIRFGALTGRKFGFDFATTVLREQFPSHDSRLMKLSHYTSYGGLVGIVRSQSLWATEFLGVNDTTEFVYGLSAIWNEALAQALPKIPADLLNPSKGLDHLRSLVPDYVATLKKQVEESDGYGSLYVTSFARARGDDENERGILTLWDRYTRNEGFCLQFDREDLQRLVSSESTRHSYGWLQMAEVVYGIDREDYEFRELSDQMSLRTLRALYFETRDLRLTKDLERIGPESTFLQRLVSFCLKHKDPAFQDEREIRIFACPVNVTQGRVFTGLAVPKTIYRPRQGARYVILGEHLLPGVKPERVLIGPRTKLLSEWELDALYPPPPVFRKSNIPIR